MNNLNYTVLRNGRRIAKRQFEAAQAAEAEKEAEEEKTPTLTSVLKKLKTLDTEMKEFNARPISPHLSTGRIYRDCMNYGEVAAAYKDILKILDKLREVAKEEEEESNCVSVKIRVQFSEIE